MTIWAEKICSIDEWTRVQTLFEKHFMTLAGPRDMMLICVEGPPGSAWARLIAITFRVDLRFRATSGKALRAKKPRNRSVRAMRTAASGG
ncbi:MAG: hypothetical protein ABSA62_14970 [Methyloceanibacter sp.]|jgi:thiamine monophosphate kinase